MPANPKPCHGVAFQYTNSTITKSYPDRPNVFSGIDAFEMQGRMKRVLLPETVRFPGALLDVFLKSFVGVPKRWQRARFHRSL